MPVLPKVHARANPAPLLQVIKNSPGTLETFLILFVNCPHAPTTGLRADEIELKTRGANGARSAPFNVVWLRIYAGPFFLV
jgi:hypothetical protein